jgi:hypothetical protein
MTVIFVVAMPGYLGEISIAISGQLLAWLKALQLGMTHSICQLL